MSHLLSGNGTSPGRRNVPPGCRNTIVVTKIKEKAMRLFSFVLL